MFLLILIGVKLKHFFNVIFMHNCSLKVLVVWLKLFTNNSYRPLNNIFKYLISSSKFIAPLKLKSNHFKS